MTLIIYIDFLPSLTIEGVEWGCLYTRTKPPPESTLWRFSKRQAGEDRVRERAKAVILEHKLFSYFAQQRLL